MVKRKGVMVKTTQSLMLSRTIKAVLIVRANNVLKRLHEVGLMNLCCLTVWFEDITNKDRSPEILAPPTHCSLDSTGHIYFQNFTVQARAPASDTPLKFFLERSEQQDKSNQIKYPSSNRTRKFEELGDSGQRKGEELLLDLHLAHSLQQWRRMCRCFLDLILLIDRRKLCVRKMHQREKTYVIIVQIWRLSQDLLQLHLKVPEGKGSVHTNTDSLGLLVYTGSIPLDPKHYKRRVKG